MQIQKTSFEMMRWIVDRQKKMKEKNNNKTSKHSNDVSLGAINIQNETFQYDESRKWNRDEVEINKNKLQ